jgi:hypothetical protein
LGAGIGDDVVREGEPERGAGGDGRQGDDRGLGEQAPSDHLATEPDRSQNADLLAAFDRRAVVMTPSGRDIKGMFRQHRS